MEDAYFSLFCSARWNYAASKDRNSTSPPFSFAELNVDAFLNHFSVARYCWIDLRCSRVIIPVGPRRTPSTYP